MPERITGEVLIEVHSTSVNPIDYRFDFDKTADAHRRIESGVDHGRVVITIKLARVQK